MSCSTGIPFDCSPGSGGTLSVGQTLSLVATLYQESNGDFQEKTAKLILRQSKVRTFIIIDKISSFSRSTVDKSELQTLRFLTRRQVASLAQSSRDSASSL